MIDVSMTSDWDFIVALSATAGVLALAILAYVFLVYRREGGDEHRAERDAAASAPDVDPEPVFFKRYVPPAE